MKLTEKEEEDIIKYVSELERTPGLAIPDSICRSLLRLCMHWSDKAIYVVTKKLNIDSFPDDVKLDMLSYTCDKMCRYISRYDPTKARPNSFFSTIAKNNILPYVYPQTIRKKINSRRKKIINNILIQI